MSRFNHVSIVCLVILLLAMPKPSAAQSYTAQELNAPDAVKAVGPNLSGEVAVRSGFTAALSHLAARGAAPVRIGLVVVAAPLLRLRQLLSGLPTPATGASPDGQDITANGINDPGLVVGSSNIRFGSRQCRPNIPDAPPSRTCSFSAVHAVIWTKRRRLRDLGTLPGDTASEGSESTIRETWSDTRAVPMVSARFSGRGGRHAESRHLYRGAVSKARAINDSGLIVGSPQAPSPECVRCLWTPGVFKIRVRCQATIQ